MPYVLELRDKKYPKMSIEEVASEWALSSQEMFKAPTQIHPNREMFFELWKKKGFKKAVFKCTRSWKDSVKGIMPDSIKKAIKKVIRND